MFSLTPLLFIILTFQYSQSLQLFATDNATLTLTKSKEKTDIFSYEKFSKNTSTSIHLSFLLRNTSNVVIEKVVLKVNNEDTAIYVVDIGKEPPRAAKLYLKRESFLNNEIKFKIMFSKIENAIAGLYNICLTISGVDYCAKSYVFSSPIVTKFTKPKLGLEGDPIRVTCVYEAYPNATSIVWTRISGDNFETANRTIISSNDRIIITRGKDTNRENDTMYITKLLKNDTGIYMCTVITETGQDFALVKINVKDRWAALYPFMGIVVEVAILVTAILAYEKYGQMKLEGRKGVVEGHDDDDANGTANEVEGGVAAMIPLAGKTVVDGDDHNDDENERANSVDRRQREAVSKNV